MNKNYWRIPRSLRVLAFPLLTPYILWQIWDEERNFARKYGLDKT